MKAYVLDMETMLCRGLEVPDLTGDCDRCGRDGLNESDRSGDRLASEDSNSLRDVGLNGVCVQK